MAFFLRSAPFDQEMVDCWHIAQQSWSRNKAYDYKIAKEKHQDFFADLCFFHLA